MPPPASILWFGIVATSIAVITLYFMTSNKNDQHKQSKGDRPNNKEISNKKQEIDENIISGQERSAQFVQTDEDIFENMLNEYEQKEKRSQNEVGQGMNEESNTSNNIGSDDEWYYHKRSIQKREEEKEQNGSMQKQESNQFASNQPMEQIKNDHENEEEDEQEEKTQNNAMNNVQNEEINNIKQSELIQNAEPPSPQQIELNRNDDTNGYSRMFGDVDSNSIDIVNGYIKEIQILLPTNKPFYNIPSLVNYIVLSYFYEAETWNPHKKGRSIEINNNVITQSKHEWNTIYGTISCKKGYKYKWRLEIIGVTSRTYDDLYIGVASSMSNVSVITATHCQQAECWSFCNNPVASSSKVFIHGINAGDYAKLLQHGDVVEMCLDLEKCTLSFIINDVDYGVAIQNIPNDKQYNLAVSMNYYGTQIKLLKPK